MHYVDEGPRDGEIILCLHGQPTWSYLYRKMIPPLTNAGFRVIAPDLIGFGKSEKITERKYYTYSNHIAWMEDFLVSLDVKKNVTLVGQDWGGLIGLRVLTQNPEFFARVVIANTGLPDNSEPRHIPPLLTVPMKILYKLLPALPVPDMIRKITQNRFNLGFFYWIKHCDKYPDFMISEIMLLAMRGRCGTKDVANFRRAYDAPFPSEEYKQGPRQLPTLVPIFPDNVEMENNRQAWHVLEKLSIPFLTSFSDEDPVTMGAHKKFQRVVPGAQCQTHKIIKGAGHFLQEEEPEEFAQNIIEFCQKNPIN